MYNNKGSSYTSLQSWGNSINTSSLSTLLIRPLSRSQIYKTIDVLSQINIKKDSIHYRALTIIEGIDPRNHLG